NYRLAQRNITTNGRQFIESLKRGKDQQRKIDSMRETIYVAKNLWRDELMHAKYNLDFVMKIELLRKLLEWRIELDHNWSLKPGSLGRELKKRLDPQTWADLANTYVGPAIEENWRALFRTTALF